MRTIHVRGVGVELEELLDLVAEIEFNVPAPPADAPTVQVLVNGRVLGPVSLGVWQVVQAKLEASMAELIAFDEPGAQGDAKRPPRPVAFEEMVALTDAQRAAAPAARPASGSRRRRPWRVLIAEHEPAFRERLIIAFTERGFEAVAVRDGVQALHELAAHPPDVLVADFELPRLAGDELLLRARAERGRSLATILVGATLPQVLMPECLAADAVLGQPFGAATVVAIVCAQLGLTDNEHSAERG